MGNEFLSSILPEVMDEWRLKSKAAIYRRDPEAWAADVLSHRWYGKQAAIADSYTRNVRTAVKSANGTGKSAVVSDLICHWVSVYPPDEALAIISAPTVPQIERVIFAYLKTNYGLAAARKLPLRGVINEALEWKYETPAGNQFLAFGKKPADKDIVSSFQGTRKRRTAVFLDEAGGVPADLFTAAEAVTTGSDSRFVAIGNPDRRGTEFHKLFTDPQLAQDWALFTISAFDLPSFTGEIVYDDPQQQEDFVRSLTSPSWVEHKRRAWGEGSARWLSKVMGEFPGEDDSTFFPQGTIDAALEADIEDDGEAPVVLGCDIARMGQDETVVYSNQGGRIRFVDAWGKSDNVDNARRIHNWAVRLGAQEVRVDAAGTGSGTYDNLNRLDEFANKGYVLVGILGSNSSPDPNLWSRARSWHYDQFREGMQLGKVDLDIDDKDLLEELISQTFRFNNRSALQISTKDEMRKTGLTSPDHLDAAIYSYIDLSHFTGNPVNALPVGAKVPVEVTGYEALYSEITGAGMPV